MSDHPDLDALSASLDDDGPADLDAHLQSCARCRQQVADLARARDAVARPVPPLPASVRDRAIAQALAAAGGEVPSVESPTPTEPARLRPRPPAAPSRGQWWLGGAAAAVVAVVLGAFVLLGQDTRESDQTALSGAPPTQRDATAEAVGPAGAGPVAATGGFADLGDVPSIDVLRSRVLGTEAFAAAGRVAGGSASSGGAEAPVPAPTPAQAAAPAAPAPPGTRVCEEAARRGRPQLGVVVYTATLRFQGTPAVVLGFAATPADRPATLLVLAPEQGCRLLAESPS